MKPNDSNASIRRSGAIATRDRVVAHFFPEGELTSRIIEAAFAVHNSLGVGFLERVYENALVFELRSRGVSCVQQKSVSVSYKGNTVGDYLADLVVEDRVIVELKACTAIDRVHQAQLMNYLRASRIKVGLLMNFGRPKLECKRVVI